jgi:hypothetical protein
MSKQIQVTIHRNGREFEDGKENLRVPLCIPLSRYGPTYLIAGMGVKGSSCGLLYGTILNFLGWNKENNEKHKCDYVSFLSLVSRYKT